MYKKYNRWFKIFIMKTGFAFTKAQQKKSALEDVLQLIHNKISCACINNEGLTFGCALLGNATLGSICNKESVKTSAGKNN